MFRIPHVKRAAWAAMAAALAGLMVLGRLPFRADRATIHARGSAGGGCDPGAGGGRVIGRPSQVFRARLDHALELYNLKLAPQIMTPAAPAANRYSPKAAWAAFT